MKLARKIKNRLFRSKKKTQKENAAVIVHPADNRVFLYLIKRSELKKTSKSLSERFLSFLGMGQF
ncbi:polyribitolphosphotransferase [Bacillus subtilis subsp. subtilis str. OH 131.1]|nr:polyribitolphosphotransferase [Bacillus subtilis subsp. subtilis str. OH 131.1]